MYKKLVFSKEDLDSFRNEINNINNNIKRLKLKRNILLNKYGVITSEINRLDNIIKDLESSLSKLHYQMSIGSVVPKLDDPSLIDIGDIFRLTFFDVSRKMVSSQFVKLVSLSDDSNASFISVNSELGRLIYSRRVNESFEYNLDDVKMFGLISDKVQSLEEGNSIILNKKAENM